MSVVQEANGPADLATLESLESELGARLPDDFRDFLLAENGGQSPDAEVDLHDGTATGELVFLGVGLEEEYEDVAQTLETFADRLPKGLVPIVMDGGGNLFCLSLRAVDFGSVWFFDADADEANRCYPSFASFVGSVRIV